MFSNGIRKYAYSVLGKDKIRELYWTDNKLTIIIGRQQSNWRLRQNRWHCDCSCGYKNSFCVHAYIATMILQEVIKKEAWGTSNLPERIKLNRSENNFASKAIPKRDLNYRRESRRPLQHTSIFSKNETQKSNKDVELEVEIDFYHDPKLVVVRFYRKEDNFRTLLTMQRVADYAWQAVRKKSSYLCWQERDLRFLSWLSSKLKNRVELTQNLTVLKIRKEKFKYWLERWQDEPTRLIERSSQKPLSGKEQDVNLHIELDRDKDWVQISAIVEVIGGKKYHLHEIFHLLASGQRRLVLDGKMLDFKSPISREVLTELFAKKSPRMKYKHICEHLPHLLENRLDIIYGSAVMHTRCDTNISLKATNNGADIILQLKAGQLPLLTDGIVLGGTIKEKDDKFLITTYSPKEITNIINFLKCFPWGKRRTGELKITGTVENIEQFVAAWQKLPDVIEKTASKKLQNLLMKHNPVRPEIVLNEENSFVNMQVSWRVGTTSVTDSDMMDALTGGRSVVRTREGSWLSFDGNNIKQTRESLVNFGLSDNNTPLRFFKPEAKKVLSEMQQKMNLLISQNSVSFADRLLHQPDEETLALPTEFAHVLRDYQQRGFEFLSNRCAYGIGAILADDMGLGKTVQALALITALLKRKNRKGLKEKGALIICPASVVSVWSNEVEKFCPTVRCIRYVGVPNKREQLLQDNNWDLLVMTYAIARKDLQKLLQYKFTAIILDEAQYIKNPDSQVAQAVKLLKTSQCIALTGTPLENRLLDLWSIMDFVNPNFLGSSDSFLGMYDGAGNLQDLNKKISPVILRRTKEEVAQELPPRSEEVLKVVLSDDEQELYKQELLRARRMIKEQGTMEMLASLTRLRQLCCHPQLLKKDDKPYPSAKLNLLLERVTVLLEEGHSALIFSQFTSMLALIDDALPKHITRRKIIGSTSMKKRDEEVKAFNSSNNPELFLLSLKAAGTGLTLTKADYVFIFDPWWNPAVERQAIDRTHRIGQDKPVIAYKLVATDTIEEKVLQMQMEKSALFDKVMGDNNELNLSQKLSKKDIQTLLM